MTPPLFRHFFRVRLGIWDRLRFLFGTPLEVTIEAGPIRRISFLLPGQTGEPHLHIDMVGLPESDE